jgi:DNA-binding MarR family transcriptional regulator
MTTDTAGAAQLGFLLAEGLYGVFNALQGTVIELLAELGLSEALADALWQLCADAPMSRGALAARLHCDPSNVTFLVDRLEERGLAERTAAPHDRRVKAVSLTPAGAAARERLVAAVATSPVFARLTPDQQQQLAGLLHTCLGLECPPNQGCE